MVSKDDIVRMAREAGVPMEYSFVSDATVWHLHPRFERFANLVADAERECIAKWVEEQRNDIPATGVEFASAIRARNNV